MVWTNACNAPVVATAIVERLFHPTATLRSRVNAFRLRNRLRTVLIRTEVAESAARTARREAGRQFVQASGKLAGPRVLMTQLVRTAPMVSLDRAKGAGVMYDQKPVQPVEMRAEMDDDTWLVALRSRAAWCPKAIRTFRVTRRGRIPSR